MSTAEAEYISSVSCSTQLLWMKHQFEDYQINANSIPIYCDNTDLIKFQTTLFDVLTINNVFFTPLYKAVKT